MDGEPNDDPSEAVCIFDPGAVDVVGTLHYVGGATGPGPDPWDYFIFWAPAGSAYSLLTSAVTGQPNIDTTLSVLDSTGIELAFGDDIVDANGNPTSLYSEIPTWTVPADGTYYVAVATYQGSSDQNGSYELLIVSN